MHVFKQKDVGAFHVPVQDLAAVEGKESTDNLDEDVPNLLLFNVSLSFLVVTDLLEDISVVSIFHNQAET